MEVNKRLGSKLKELRMLYGLSQEKLAEHLDISTQQLQKYEYGVNRMRADMLLQLSRILKTDVGYFFKDLTVHKLCTEGGDAGEVFRPIKEAGVFMDKSGTKLDVVFRLVGTEVQR
jgi:transcriptional regulator with XRE-family HTH domain